MGHDTREGKTERTTIKVCHIGERRKMPLHEFQEVNSDTLVLQQNITNAQHQHDYPLIGLVILVSLWAFRVSRV
jgi:hypothetical protein